jgi:hypothetical protein
MTGMHTTVQLRAFLYSCLLSKDLSIAIATGIQSWGCKLCLLPEVKSVDSGC